MDQKEPIIILPQAQQKIEIPGPSDLIQTYFQELGKSKLKVSKLLTDHIQEAMQKIMSLDGFSQDRIDHLPQEFVDAKPSLESLRREQKTQFELARQIITETLAVYANKQNIPLSKLNCVYWAGGHDEFTWDFPGSWLHVGLEEPPDIEILMPGRPKLIKYDVFEGSIPEALSHPIYVSLFKTLGSAPPEIYEKFWEKIDSITKSGGLLIATYDLPPNLKDKYIPYKPLQDLIGTSSIELNAPVANWKLNKGYYANKFNFFQKI